MSKLDNYYNAKINYFITIRNYILNSKIDDLIKIDEQIRLKESILLTIDREMEVQRLYYDRYKQRQIIKQLQETQNESNNCSRNDE